MMLQFVDMKLTVFSLFPKIIAGIQSFINQLIFIYPLLKTKKQLAVDKIYRSSAVVNKRLGQGRLNTLFSGASQHV